MSRKLMKQMANEWQSNIWLGVELLVVSVVMWFVIDTLYVRIAINCEPKGFDTDHCYLIDFSQINDNSPYYKEYTSQEEHDAEMEILVSRLRARPEIEAVGLGQNSYPYNFSNMGITVSAGSHESHGYVIYREVTPDFIKVFRYTGTRGETPEQLARILESGPNVILVADNIFATSGMPHADSIIGKRVYNLNTEDSVVVGAAYNVIRYDDYSPGEYSRSIIGSSQKLSYYRELVVRVKENMDHDFIDNLMKDAGGNLRVGNLYISNVRSFDDIKSNFIRDKRNETRNNIVTIVFLALNIFLGILGTFWFRTQQRNHEIAIRMVNGATHGDVFRRAISEGELLLLIVTPLAIGMDLLLTKWDLNSYYGGYFVTTRFWICVGLSYGLMALMIALGAAIPATKAMKTAPATALSEE